MESPLANESGPAKRKRVRTLVAGLGNLLLKDDGVGVHAVRELRKILPRRILAVEVGTAVLDALHLFEWADRIVALDAMKAGGPPGTLYRFGVDDVEYQGTRESLHEAGLVAALGFLEGRRPEIVILGVEPEVIDFGMNLSPSVEAVLPDLIAAAKELATA
jgi:hydrogenase maturation protease